MNIKDEIFKPEMKLWEKIVSVITFVFDSIYRVLVEFAKLVLLVIVVVVSAQVFARFFHRSIMWSEEVALLLMVWTAFISMAIGVEKGLHIAITIFYGLFPKKIQNVIYKLILVAMIFFAYILIKYGINLISVSMGNKLPATQWPNGIKFIMMPVGGIFIFYFAVLDLFGLNRFRHTLIEDGKNDDGEKTDQQIIDEMRAAKAEMRTEQKEGK
ncbi:TRAP transporter small permease [Treponema pectinovorum]|uniref:TRAP transporter small permease n=1 Tax=Treponema pectinovorum TaxID=164 RepID=UPI0021C40320|nr:TRAP transporter small permease [Treponema pectinovorum]